MNKLEKGFSLLEMMVALGLSGMVTVGYLHFNNQLVHSQKNFEDRMSINELTSKAQSILSEKDACRQTFSNLNVTTLGNINELKQNDGTGFLVVGQDYAGGRVRLQSMQMTQFRATASDRGILELQLIFELINRSTGLQKDKNRVGGPQVLKKISLIVSHQSNIIRECFGQQSSQVSSESIFEKSCQAFYGTHIGGGACDQTVYRDQNIQFTKAELRGNLQFESFDNQYIWVRNCTGLSCTCNNGVAIAGGCNATGGASNVGTKSGIDTWSCSAGSSHVICMNEGTVL